MPSKVHPNAAGPERAAPDTAVACTGSSAGHDEEQPAPPAVLTVWRKSLLFNCDGFTVFDAKGDLAFRVDSYDAGSRRRRAEVVLMDATGSALLTVRRKRTLGVLAEHWVVYDGDAADVEAAADDNRPVPLLSVRRRSRRASSSSSETAPVAYVTALTLASLSGRRRTSAEALYEVEGSYGRRACAVRDARGVAVAEVRRKEAVGDDVFRLVADPCLGATLAMGVVIALDEMHAF